ncbi:similar to Evx1 (predicted), partial [Rattus norvegicus]
MSFASSDPSRQAFLLAPSLQIVMSRPGRPSSSPGLLPSEGFPLGWRWVAWPCYLELLLTLGGRGRSPHCRDRPHTPPTPELGLGLAQSSNPLLLFLSSGVVSEPTHEGQATAAGHDVAAPSRPRLLHLHDEPRGGRGRPALPLPVAPAPALLLARGPGCRVRRLGRRFALQRPPAPARHLPRALAALPATRTAVRLPPPTALPRAGARTGCLGRRPLLLPRLPQRPLQWAGAEGRRRLRLHLCLHLPLGLLPHVRPLCAQQGLLRGVGPERGGAPHQ